VEYVITADPVVIPLTTPVDASTVATDVLLLLHVPPDSDALTEVVAPTQTLAEPATDAGEGLTVTDAVAYTVPQPLVTVYVIVATPEAIPVTTPEPLTVAIAIFDVAHVPPGTLLERIMVEPAHTPVKPAIVPALAVAVTVTTLVVLQPVLTL
jgi:hypothetical protein